ncbi:hypothetical protein FRC04_002817 [Tulasnella sp. 424]|nr:hypothetical protein FRC04_002817 [Tulasnella sp. 424]
MFFKLLSTIALKKSSASTNEPTGQRPKPAGPTTTPPKKPSVLGRVLKAMKSPLSKTRDQQRKYPATTPSPLEGFYTPSVGYDPFSRYPTFDLDALPNSTLAAAKLPLPYPSRSPLTTPTTIDSGYLSALTIERSPRSSSDLRRDPQAEERQVATGRSVEALEAGPQSSQALRHTEADRIWDAEGAKMLAKEEEKKAKRRARRFDLQVKSDDRLVQVGLQAQLRRRRDFSNERDRRADLNDTSRDCVPVEAKSVGVATRRGQAVEEPSTRERLLAGRGVFGSENEGSLGERDEDDGSYERPISLESPATRWQRYLPPPSRA